MPAAGLRSANAWLWIPSLYLAEGIPNAVVATAATTMLQDMEVPEQTIALYTGMLYLPWVIKPFWAPFVDIMRTKRWWTVAMQLMLAAGMAVVALSLPLPWFFGSCIAAFWGVAFCSATHDIAADGFYLLALNERKQAFFVGIRSTFYRLAVLIVSGGVVYCAGKLIQRGVAVPWAWAAMFAALAAFFLAVAVYHAFILPRPDVDKPDKAKNARDIVTDFGRAFVTFFRKPHIVIALAFMLLYRLPEALLVKIVPMFLHADTTQGGLGLDTAQVGLVNGIYGVLGLVVGGILGGICVSRYGLRRMLWPMALLLTLPCALYWYLAVAQPSDMLLLGTGLFVEQFGYGFGFTAYMMYLIYFCDGTPYSTSHYAFCTGLMALGLMLPSMFAGHMLTWLGYTDFFRAVMLCCVPTFVVCLLVTRTGLRSDREPAEASR